ncbi:MAG TPA: hypothetical protein VMV05_10430 [bacterium]|nr:hypothetical protein [bacterium]
MNGLKARVAFKLLAIGLTVFLDGCAASLPYQRAESEGGYGYTDKAAETPGTFQIDFMAEGRTLEFAKYAAYYRGAELTFETGYRYFIVMRAYDLSKKGTSWGDPKNVSGGIPGVRIIIQCFRDKPSQPSYDAYQYLSVAKMPGSELIYSVAQRKGDQAGQPLNQ